MFIYIFHFYYSKHIYNKNYYANPDCVTKNVINHYQIFSSISARSNSDVFVLLMMSFLNDTYFWKTVGQLSHIYFWEKDETRNSKGAGEDLWGSTENF